MKTSIQKAPHTFHNFNSRDEKFFFLKEEYYELDDTEARARFIKLTGETRRKARLGIIYGENEKYLLKEFLKEVVKIKLSEGGWSEIPETALAKIITEHTTEEFNPRNFLLNEYNSSRNGEASKSGGFLFFNKHNIENAQKILDLLNQSQNPAKS